MVRYSFTRLDTVTTIAVWLLNKRHMPTLAMGFVYFAVDNNIW